MSLLFSPCRCAVRTVAPVLLVGLLFSSVQSAPFLYSVSQDDANLRVVDAADGTTVKVIPLFTSTGRRADPMTGFAIDPSSQASPHPATWAAYGIVRTGGANARNLVSIDLVTGDVSVIGNTGVAMAGLTFAPDGTLYAVSGDGGPEPNEALFTVDVTDGSSTLIGVMGAGNDGEAIGYNPDDGLIYHFSGLRETDPIGREIFEFINPADASTVTTILPEGTPDAEEALALLYRGGGEFYASFLREDSDPTVGSNQFGIIDTTGNVTTVGHFDHRSKGLALGRIPEPSTLALAALILLSSAAVGLRRRWGS